MIRGVVLTNTLVIDSDLGGGTVSQTELSQHETAVENLKKNLGGRDQLPISGPLLYEHLKKDKLYSV